MRETGFPHAADRLDAAGDADSYWGLELFGGEGRVFGDDVRYGVCEFEALAVSAEA